MQCTVDGCDNSIKARLLCAKHYYRLKKHGDPLVAAFIPAKPGAPKKFLLDLGTDGEGCVIWPFAKNNMGYGQLYIDGGRKVLASRAACEMRNGPPPTERHHAAHSCGRGHFGCVAPWHLSWKTPAENSADRRNHGTHYEGATHPQSKLSADARRQISALSGLVSHAEIARRLGVSQTLVSKVASGKKPGGMAAIRRKLPASGIRGVRQMPSGKWQARVTKDKTMHHLGSFESRDAAETAILDWIAAQIGVAPAKLMEAA